MAVSLCFAAINYIVSCIFFALVTVVVAAEGSAQTVGRIDGEGGVTADGAATYVIPLWVAPGRADLQPDLALAYNSQSGTGWLGVGWSLTGFSQISRCRRTFARDGEAREIQFADGQGGDRYCLDGQPLVKVGGDAGPESAYGADGTEYRTEYDTQTRIISHAPDLYGPTAFSVYLKNGRILTYGRSSAARLEGQRVAVRTSVSGTPPTQQWTETRTTVRYVWALEEARDRAGNYLRVMYARDNTQFGYDLRPTEIHYTGFTPSAGSTTASLAAARVVRLLYELRPDQIEVFVSGLRLLKSLRLSRIESWAPSNVSTSVLVRAYDLRYSASASGRSVLRAVRECGGNQVCKPETTFDYTENDGSFTDRPIAGSAGQSSSVPSAVGWRVAEVDGDGRDDLLTEQDDFHGSPTPGSAVLAGPPPGSLFTTLPPLGLPKSAPPAPRFIDINGDGIPDRAALDTQSAQGPVTPPPGEYRNTVHVSGPQGYVLLEDEPFRLLVRAAFVLDLNGDGSQDQLQPVGSSGGYSWRYRLNVNGSFGAWVNTALRVPGADPRDPNGVGPYFGIALDPTGGGKVGLLAGGGNFIRLGRTGLEYLSPTLPADDFSAAYCDVNFIDLNGDGLRDWVARGSGDSVALSINTGNGFLQPATWSLGSYQSAWPVLRAINNRCDIERSGGSGVRVVDYNNDGRDDLLLMAGYTDATVGGLRRLVVLVSTGNGFVPRSLPIMAGVESGPGVWKHSQVLDVNGDGLTDFAQRQNSAPNSGLHVFTRNGQLPDLLRRVTDGMGAYETFDYVPVTDGTPVYAAATAQCAYPLSCVKRGLWVVATHGVDNGEPTPRTWSYRYAEGRTDLQLGAWLGFGSRSILDNVSGASTTITSDNRTRVGTMYPYARLPLTTTVRTRSEPDPLSAVWRTRTIVATYTVVNPTPESLFVYAARVEERMTEQNFFAEATLIAHSVRSETRDSFNNVIASEEQAYPIVAGAPGTMPSRTTRVATVDNFSPSWIIGLTRSVTVTSTTPDSQTATRTIETDYTADTAQLWKIRVEPRHESASEQVESGFFLLTTVGRDPYGSINSIRHEASGQARIESVSFDPAEHIVVMRRENAQGHVWSTLSYHPGLGLATLVRDPNGVEVAVEYDAFARLKALRPEGSASVVYSYDKDQQGRFRITVDTQGVGTEELLYDRLGREIQRTWPGADALRAIVETGYDSLGRTARVSIPRFVGEPYRYEVFTYDDMNRLVQVQHPDFSLVSTTYDGLRTDVRDEKGNRWFTLKDELGRTVRSVRVGDNGRELTTRLSYGPFGLLRRAIDPSGNVVEIEHDHLGRRTRVADPHTGISTFRYTGFGEVKGSTDGSKRTWTIVRDLLGRPTSVTTADGETTLRWDTAPHGIGRLASSTSPDGVTTMYEFDQFGRPATMTWDVEKERFAFHFTYDEFGRLYEMTYPPRNVEKFALTRTYTPSGFVKSVQDARGGAIWEVDERDAAGRVVREKLANGLSTTRTFDMNRGWPRTIKTASTTPGMPPIQDLEFEWELNGNLFRRYEHLGSWAEEFHYDPLDRLTTWWAFNLAHNTRVPAAFTYDDLGNMLSRTLPDQPPGQDTIVYGYGGQGAGPSAPTTMWGKKTWEYDASGNRITAPQQSVDYTAANLPRRVQNAKNAAKFLYDAAGRRVLKVNSTGESTLSIGGFYERRRAKDTTTHVFLVPGDGRIVAQYSVSDAVTKDDVAYLHDDHLGSIESVTGARGALLERRAYDPFGGRQNPDNRGRPLQTPPTSPVNLGFTAHSHDDELGLINMRGRVYDPLLGHFLSADPVVGDVADGAMWNRYAYAVNNPATLIDPTGLQAKGSPNSNSGTERSRTHVFGGVTIQGESRTHVFGGVTIQGDYRPSEPAPSSPTHTPPAPQIYPIQGGGSDTMGSAESAPSADDKGSGHVTTPAQLAESKNPSGSGQTHSLQQSDRIAIFIVRDWGIGDHAALLLERKGQEPLLYDPAGSYKDEVPDEFKGTGAVVTGHKYARESRFINFHKKAGSTVETYDFALSTPDADIVEARLLGDPETGESGLGDVTGGFCTVSVCQAIEGTSKFGAIFHVLPGGLADTLRELKTPTLPTWHPQEKPTMLERRGW